MVFPDIKTPAKKADDQAASGAPQDKVTDTSAAKPTDDSSDTKHDDEPAVAPSPAISRRPSGRFMDVVHPSSVMRGHGIHQPRTGVTLQPTGSYLSGRTGNDGQRGVNMTEHAEDASSDMMADDNTVRSSAADREIKRRPPRLVLQPDPSHVAEGLTSDNVSLNTKDVPDYESMASEAEASTDSAFIEEGLLAEDAPTKAADSEGLTMDELMADDDHLVTDAEAGDEVAEHYDEAADTDITADRTSLEATIDEIEAGEVGEQLDADASSVDVSSKQSVADTSELDSELMAIESMDESDAEIADETPRRPHTPGDIPQQYTAGDEIAPDPEPMFDAAASQPATGEALQPDKKKSGIGTILLIILFALIGVGGGAAAYFFLLYYK
ncbi:hypothetical protein FBF32_02855 [Candidatus Saccharibacteria bacterium oral taxon 488]|nr:hypothetical protein FBF32_02855 [Candidatus Saccharibacteria bacterium oral taxon 488]